MPYRFVVAKDSTFYSSVAFGFPCFQLAASSALVKLKLAFFVAAHLDVLHRNHTAVGKPEISLWTCNNAASRNSIFAFGRNFSSTCTGTCIVSLSSITTSLVPDWTLHLPPAKSRS